MRPFILLLTIVLLSSCQEDTPVVEETPQEPIEIYDPVAPGIEDIKELIGYWHDELRSDTSVFYEQWEQDSTDVLKGLGYVLSDADTVFIEYLSISFINEEFLYNVRSGNPDNEAVSFLLMPSGEDTLRFYNNLNEFPQEILYTKEDDSWRVAVSNVDGRQLDFHLVRQEADGPA